MVSVPSSDLDKQRSRKDWIEKQNIVIRNCTPNKLEPSRSCTPDGRSKHARIKTEGLGGSCSELGRIPCGLSLSTLTGLSGGVRAARPCEMIKMTDRVINTRTPSTLLMHGYDWVSAEDQRILTLMVLRREAQMQEQEVLQSARRLWERDKILYHQTLNEKRKKWNDRVREKRKQEKIELERRKETAEESLTQHVADLKKTINERHARCELRHKEMQMHKRHPRGVTDADTELHRLRRQQQALQSAALSADHIYEVTAKEARAAQNLAAIMYCRERTMKDRRLERDRRMEAAQQTRQALEDEYKEWCQENKEQLSSRMCLSECRQSDIIEWKRKMAHDTNVNKTVLHAHAMAALGEEERLKEQTAREELLKKEARMRCVQNKRENFITKSRQHAFTTAALRLQIKASYPLSL